MALQTKIVLSVVSKKAMQGLGLFWRTLKGVTGTIFSMRNALVALGGAAGFGFLVKRSLNATDSLAKTASKIGTTTQALSKLQYAARITGVEQNTLNMAMQRFTRRAAEAAKGTGEAKGALQELNIDAKELQKLPLDQQMKVLADAFGNVRGESNKLRIAFKLFDSEGAALVNTLALGSGGLDKLFGRAKALGLVMSGDAAKGVEAANDALGDLFSIARGLTDQFSAALAPVIQHATNTFTNFILELAKTKGGIEGVGQAMAKNFIDGLIKAVKGIQSFANGVITVANTVHKAFRRFFPDEVEQELNKKIDDITAKMRGIGMAAQGGMKFDKELHDQLEQSRLVLIEQRKKMQADAKGIKLIDLDKTISTLEDFKTKIGTIPEAVKNITPPVIDEVNNMEEAFNGWSQALPTVDMALQDLSRQGIDGLTQALTDGIAGTKSMSEAMRDMARSIIQSLIKMFVQYKIVQPMFDFLFGAAGGSPSTIGGTGMTSGGHRGASQAGAYRGTRAIGGSVQAGSPYLVGERGAEMFVPNQSGAIVPNNRLGGDGVTINQSINISTGVSQTVRAEIATLMPQITEATKSAVADARMRGGAYSKALMGG